MTWVRYDDNVRNHPKVEALDDATYRLWRETIEWCAQNLTDGAVLTRQLSLTSIRATARRARKLVERGLWHSAGYSCPSEKCPPSSDEGWIVHDYWDYQPTRQRVREEQAAAAERKRRWMERRKNGGGNGVPNAQENALQNGVGNTYPAPPRPVRAGRDYVPPAPPAAFGDGASAVGERKIICRTCGSATTSAYHRNACIRSDVIAKGNP